jgi:hypothetical protein
MSQNDNEMMRQLVTGSRGVIHAKFQPGQIIATPGAIGKFDLIFLGACLRRHLTCDWGVLDADDRAESNRALRDGSRILSNYLHDSGAALWIVTEADRSATTMLLPEEY